MAQEIYVDNVLVTSGANFDQQKKLLIDDDLEDGLHNHPDNPFDGSWNAVHPEVAASLVFGDALDPDGNVLKISSTTTTDQPSLVQSWLSPQHGTPTYLDFKGEYIEMRFELRIPDASGVELRNRLVWGTADDLGYLHFRGYASAIARGPMAATAGNEITDPVAAISADRIAENEPALLLHAGDRENLAARNWSDGEAPPDGAIRITDTNWHDVSFTIERVSGEHFTLTQTVTPAGQTPYVVIAEDYSPDSFTFSEIVLGAASGASFAQIIDDVAVAAVLDGVATPIVSYDFADGLADSWQDIDSAASPAVVDGALKLSRSSATVAAPRRVIADFPAGAYYTLGKDGDTITLSFRTKLQALTDDPLNRLFFGLADNRPETHSIVYNPELEENGWRLMDEKSICNRAGEALLELPDSAGAVFAGRTDIMRRLRLITFPGIGAAQHIVVRNTYNGAGRMKTSQSGGRQFDYTYDSEGRLLECIVKSYDAQGLLSTETSSYHYDFAGRRVVMKVGNDTWRMVYYGHDVLLDLFDKDSDGTIDATRVYWPGNGIDHREGFVDIDADGQPTWHYYLTDQVGSILQVVNDTGAVLNQYDYDVWGNLHPETTFEKVDNRYQFQSRERNASGELYYRYRTYVPEFNQFTGLDYDLRLDPMGIAGYAFPGNYAVGITDPTGKDGSCAGCVSANSGGWFARSQVESSGACTCSSSGLAQTYLPDIMPGTHASLSGSLPALGTPNLATGDIFRGAHEGAMYVAYELSPVADVVTILEGIAAISRGDTEQGAALVTAGAIGLIIPLTPSMGPAVKYAVRRNSLAFTFRQSTPVLTRLHLPTEAARFSGRGGLLSPDNHAGWLLRRPTQPKRLANYVELPQFTTIGRRTNVDDLLDSYNPNHWDNVEDFLYAPENAALRTSYHVRPLDDIRFLRQDFQESARSTYLKYYAHSTPDEVMRLRFSQTQIDAMKAGVVPEGFIVHHKTPLFRGGTNDPQNLTLMDKTYHTNHNKQLHWYDD